MPVTTPPESTPTIAGRRGRRRPRGIRRFWQRVSEGLEVQQLWQQFHSDAHAGYELYSQEVDWERREKERGMARAFRIARELSWAFLSKLTPARRILLLIAIGMSWLGEFSMTFKGSEISFDFRGLGFLVLLFLLGLELADRVTMKRDLQIAREIHIGEHLDDHVKAAPGGLREQRGRVVARSVIDDLRSA